MSVEIEDKLNKEIDEYLAYWKKSINNLDQVYKRDQRSDDLNTVIDYIESMLNLYSEDTDQAVKKLTVNTDRFSSRIMKATNGEERAKEKIFLDEAFREDDQKKAAKLLRLIHMIEYEIPVIHYSLMMKKWMKEEEITIESYFQSRKEMGAQLKDLTKKYKRSRSTRQSTENLFAVYWMHEKDRVVRRSFEGIKEKFLQTTDTMQGCLEKEREIDREAIGVKKQLLTTLESMQVEFNQLLTQKDQMQQIATEGGKAAEEDKEKSGMLSQLSDAMLEMISSAKTGNGGKPTKTEIRSFQKNSQQYTQTKTYMSKVMGQVFSNLVKMDHIMKKFIEREDQRSISKEKMNIWKRLVAQEMENVMREEPAKQRLQSWYTVSMKNEKNITVTGQSGLQKSLQRFITAKSASFTDGVWHTLQDERPIEDMPFECLAPEKIANYHAVWKEYKDATKGMRKSFKMVNRALLFITVLGLSYMAALGIARILPAAILTKVAGLINFGVGGVVIPASMTIAIPIAAIATIVMVVMHIRNARAIKEKFEMSMQNFKNPYAEEEENIRQSSYVEWMKKGLMNFCSMMRCRKQGAIEIKDDADEIDEEINSVPSVVITVAAENEAESGGGVNRQLDRNNEIESLLLGERSQYRNTSALMIEDGESEGLDMDEVADSGVHRNGMFVIEDSDDENDALVEVTLDESNHSRPNGM